MKSLLSKAKDCGTVIKWATISRVCFLLLQVISHNLIPDHTGSMQDVFMKVHRDPHDVVTETALGGFDNWDSEYFIFIAEHGYTKYDQTIAFFPLYPILMRFLSKTLLYPLSFFTTQRSILLCSGVILNFVVFPLATATLYLLTLEVSKNRKLAFLSAALFCINPASVFMSAVYTESFFFLFTLSGLLFLEYNQPWMSSALFALAGATRSNGIVLTGFLAFRCLAHIIDMLTGNGSVNVTTAISILKTLISTFLQCLITIGPFSLFQYYSYSIYCTSPDHQPSSPPWCAEWDLLPPLPYSYVQHYYWNVGSLRYFQLKQLPNFLLAAPMVILSSYCIGKYISCSVAMTTEKKYASICDQKRRLLPYIVHLGFLLVFGFFVINVQVLTRFICSSSPVIYWLSAEVLLEALADLKATVLLDPKIYSWKEMSQGIIKILFSKMSIRPPPKTHRTTIISRYLVGYFIVYVILGYVLHCNFYPWT